MITGFMIPGEPQGKARAKVYHTNGITRAVTPEKTVVYENLVKLAYAGRAYHEGPVCMAITAYYSIPKSAGKKKIGLMIMDKIRPTKKPDMDNIAKVVCDALNGIAYKDDSQIVELSLKKHYSLHPMVEVVIRSYSPD